MSIDLDIRAREILQWIVEDYLSTGEPVGSRTLSHRLNSSLSAATIRTVMSHLTDANLIYSPHTSAGRQPTQAGLRFYVDSLMQRGELSQNERLHIETKCQLRGTNLREIYDNASTALSGLSSCVGVVLAPKIHKPISQIQFLKLEPQKVLVIIVTKDGMVENRIIDLAVDVSSDMLTQAANYLNDRISGRTVSEAREIITHEIGHGETQLQKLTAALIEQGVILPPSSLDDDYIFVRGQSQLLGDEVTSARLGEIRDLLTALEEHKNMLDIMDAVRDGQGVQIFIGSENRSLGGQPGWSTVIRPYRDETGRIIGATGVIGPTRLNYKRIVPIVDYTAQVMEKLLSTLSLEKS